MKKLFSVLLLIVLFTLATQLQTPFAQDGNQTHSVILTDEQVEYPLGLHLAYLEDPTGQLTIEAENEVGGFYRLERLCRVVGQQWTQPTVTSKEAVVADVRQFIGAQQVYDDLTLLVMKQK